MNKICILCPTYNRRKFFPNLIYQFYYQTYPKHLLTLIILDDSFSSNSDIIDNIEDYELKSRILYLYSKDKQTIGQKRNILNNIAKYLNTDYIVWFDDDDYYSPTKIEQDINALINNNFIIGGLHTILIYYPKLDKIYQYGPKLFYFTKLSRLPVNNGTLVYNIKYLDYGSYDNNDIYNEEIKFLQNKKINIYTFNINNYILIAHNSNTIDKLQFIKYGKLLVEKIDNLIIDKYLLDFYKKLI
jgi:glycosyltransferase involved in cell wall biosynthesis